MPPEREQIPDGDGIHRLILFPRMYSAAREFIWTAVFEFPGGQGESVIWSRYAPAPVDVHQHGSALEERQRARKPECSYEGYISAVAGAVREAKNVHGHGFSVSHEPAEGVHHSEIRYAPRDGVAFEKTDKNELKIVLRNCFSDLRPHAAAS